MPLAHHPMPPHNRQNHPILPIYRFGPHEPIVQGRVCEPSPPHDAGSCRGGGGSSRAGFGVLRRERERWAEGKNWVLGKRGVTCDVLKRDTVSHGNLPSTRRVQGNSSSWSE